MITKNTIDGYCGKQRKKLPACPEITALTRTSSKWKVLFFRDFLLGTIQSEALKKPIGHVTQEVPAAQFLKIEGCWLIRCKDDTELLSLVEYTLTEQVSVLDSIVSLGAAYQIASV